MKSKTKKSLIILGILIIIVTSITCIFLINRTSDNELKDKVSNTDNNSVVNDNKESSNKEENDTTLDNSTNNEEIDKNETNEVK